MLWKVAGVFGYGVLIGGGTLAGLAVDQEAYRVLLLAVLLFSVGLVLVLLVRLHHRLRTQPGRDEWKQIELTLRRLTFDAERAARRAERARGEADDESGGRKEAYASPEPAGDET